MLIGNNNHIRRELPVVSSETEYFEKENLISDLRQDYFAFAGIFEITEENRNYRFYNSGLDLYLTGQIALGNYTKEQLRVEVQSSLDGLAGTATVTLVPAGDNTLFRIQTQTGLQVDFGHPLNTLFKVLGFTTTSGIVIIEDETADEIVNGTADHLTWDLATQKQVSLVAIFTEAYLDMPFSSNAIIKLQASNIANWSSPDYEEVLTVSTDCIYLLLETPINYRHYRLVFDDVNTSIKPIDKKIGHIYLGDSLSVNRNLSNGFNYSYESPTRQTESYSGSVIKENSFLRFSLSSNQISILRGEDKKELERFIRLFNTYSRFVIVMDQDEITGSVGDSIKYVTLSSTPKFNHIIFDYFNISFDLDEEV